MKFSLILLLFLFLSLGKANTQGKQKLSEIPQTIELMDLTDILKQLNMSISQLLEEDKKLNNNTSQSSSNNNKIDITPISSPKTSQLQSNNNVKKVDTEQIKTTFPSEQTKREQKVIDKPKEQSKSINLNINLINPSNILSNTQKSVTQNNVQKTESSSITQNTKIIQNKNAEINNKGQTINVNSNLAKNTITQVQQKNNNQGKSNQVTSNSQTVSKISTKTQLSQAETSNTPKKIQTMTTGGSSPATNSNQKAQTKSKYSDRSVANGPGPLDKSLPPVIDSKDVIVHYVYKPPTPTESSSIKSQKSQNNNIAQDKTTASRAVDTSNQNNQQKTQTKISNRASDTSSQLQNKNIQERSQTKTKTVISQPKATVIQTKEIQKSVQNIITVPINKLDDSNINSVYLNPVVAQPQVQISSKSQSKPLFSSIKYQQIKVQNSKKLTSEPQPSQKYDKKQVILPYQYIQSHADALYGQMPSYLDFQRYFVLSRNDPYLPKLQIYLLKNYGHYLNDGKLIAGFRRYIPGGDRCIDYQLLYQTIYGTFTTIITYYINSQDLQLKTLSILNYNIIDIDFVNCLVKNEKAKNCQICKSGFRNFLGRCRPIDQFCTKYITDECLECIPGKRILYGECL